MLKLAPYMEKLTDKLDSIIFTSVYMTKMDPKTIKTKRYVSKKKKELYGVTRDKRPLQVAICANGHFGW